MEDIILSLKNVRKSFSGVQALKNVDFTVRRGEVHCLVGENGSGKSTLIKIVAGVVQPDHGCEILIGGKLFRRLSAIDSMNEGIQVIYQDLSLFPNLTVAENITINQYLEENRKFVGRRQLERIARETICLIGTELDTAALVGELPIAKQQLVAICRATTRGARLIIMDEPTSSLGKKEIEYLFSIVRTLKEKGISVLFVGHKLNEVFQIADRVSVLRDGMMVGTYSAGEIDNERLIELMTGRRVQTSQYAGTAKNGKTILELRGLTKRGKFTDIHLEIREGEIVGLTGLVGSGRTELALAVFGLNPADSGRILVDGKPRRIASVQDAVECGIGYVPENRLVQGLFMQHTISKNMVVTLLDSLLNKFLLLDGKKIGSVNARWVRELGIKTPSTELPVKQLSGGNQQRVVLSKWLARNLRVLLLDGPTVGIDVGAKEEIHGIIRGLAEKGLGILMISDEAAEVVHHSHRIVVMKEGRIADEFGAASVSEAELLKKLGE